jgi:hypothetical protein
MDALQAQDLMTIWGVAITLRERSTPEKLTTQPLQIPESQLSHTTTAWPIFKPAR